MPRSKSRFPFPTCTPHVLYLLGLDHKQLTFQHGGRDMRLTDTSGEVIRDILA